MHHTSHLQKSWIIKKILKKGASVKTPFFICKFLPSPHPQFCIIVSAKVHKHATKRNRIRRRLQEAIRLHKKDFPPLLNLIFLPNYSLHDASFEDIEKHVLSSFTKA